MNMLRPLNALHVLVESVTYLGMLVEMMGTYVRAFELYSEGLRIASAIGDQWFKALCLTCVNGLVANTRLTVAVKPEDAHELLRSAVADWRLIGDPRMIGFGLRILSQSASVLGHYAEARSALEESVALNSSVGDRWGLGSAYRGLGVIAGAQGDHSQAVDMFRKSLDTFTELGASWWVARVLAEMGESILALGDDTKAVRVWREALRLATGIHGTPVALKALVGLAVLQAKRGQAQPALELLLVVLNHPASNQETKDRAEILCTELKTRLTSQQIEIAQTRARTHSFDQVVDKVLESPL
jgi:tetratricopeptide (TPR) repeat protein